MIVRFLLAVLAATGTTHSQTSDQVLVVVNESSSLSRSIGEYYARKRAVPLRNVCRIRTTEMEEIGRQAYQSTIAAGVEKCLRSANLVESILYIVTTTGVPLRIQGSGGQTGEVAAVDSELAALYEDLHGRPHPIAGPYRNPFFGKRTAKFTHPEFPIYLVTRLTGYDFNAVRALIDRALAAENRGKIVLDLKGSGAGDNWLRTAANLLPRERVILDDTTAVLAGQRDIIGYASWGSNDSSRKERKLGFGWLPGAVMTEFVSTNARTFKRPPETWRLGTWRDPKSWFAGAPQTMTGDYIEEGITGASGHVAEPYLGFTPRPDFLFPAYLGGRTLAESYYLSIPAVSWQNIVVGDPLCRLR